MREQAFLPVAIRVATSDCDCASWHSWALRSTTPKPASAPDSAGPMSDEARSCSVCANSDAAKAISDEESEHKGRCCRNPQRTCSVLCYDVNCLDQTPELQLQTIQVGFLLVKPLPDTVSCTPKLLPMSGTYLVRFVESWTSDALPDAGHQSTLLMRDLCFAVLDLQML